MNWTKVTGFLLWFIVAIIVSDLALGWLSVANTLLNIIGAFLILFLIIISVKTRLFTNFKNLKK